MNWGDILSDLDVLAEDFEAGTGFGDSPLKPKRDLAYYWVSSRMERRGLKVRLHSVRKEPTAYARVGGSSWADISSTVGSKTEDDLQLSTYVSSTADYLLVGHEYPFRGLAVSMLDGVNVNSLSVASFQYWDGGNWRTPNSLVDGTLTNSVSFSGGGRVTWQVPDDWEKRPYTAGAEDWLYWVKVSFSVVPSTTALVGQLLPIQQSRLTRPGALYTLAMMYKEAVGGSRGSWAEKAKDYLEAANNEMEVVMGGDGILDEFDVDESQAVGDLESNSVAPTSFEWLRG